jgi:hypothetical protein
MTGRSWQLHHTQNEASRNDPIHHARASFATTARQVHGSLTEEQNTTPLFQCLWYPRGILNERNEMQHNFFTFGIDRRATALVATFLHKWPHLEQPVGTPNHLPLQMLSAKGWQYVFRALGQMTLQALPIHHPDAMRPYDAFTRISPAPLYDKDSNIENLVLEPGVILPVHVAVGLADNGMSLEFAEHDDANRALPGTTRTVPLVGLAAMEPDAAAERIGADILATLTRLYPAVLVRLRDDATGVVERSQLLDEEKRKMAKTLDNMDKGRDPGAD